MRTFFSKSLYFFYLSNKRVIYCRVVFGLYGFFFFILYVDNTLDSFELLMETEIDEELII